MSLVNLVSGGVDSSLIAVMLREQGTPQYPLFIDYGQRARDQEWAACQQIHLQYNLPTPVLMNLEGFGRLVHSGLTSEERHIAEEAFLPGRNLLFLLVAASYAVEKGAAAIAIGLLSEETHLFPDQTRSFIEQAEAMLAVTLGQTIGVVAPLMDYRKAEVLYLAREKGINGTYSCHAGNAQPCGECISCQELYDAMKQVK